jgi:regulator of replication initiation timing
MLVFITDVPMPITKIDHLLERLQPDIERIEDPNTRQLVSVLLNLVEEVVSENKTLRQENQTLKDEINRLKGEQGKPTITPNTKKGEHVSCEQERRQAERVADDGTPREGFKLDRPSLEKLKEHRIPDNVLEQLECLQKKTYSSTAEFMSAVESVVGSEVAQQYRALLVTYARYKKRNRSPKVPEISIDREELCPVDVTQLPPDAEFKGYEEKVVQDLLITTDNVRFQREAYYSPSRKKTYLGPLPLGYEGGYGPHIKTQIVSMKYVNNMSIPKIEEFYGNVGILISRSYISERLTKHLEVFHQEKAQMYQTSLEQSPYQHIDDTTSRVDGQNVYTHIVCNPLATVFFTTPRKDRLTILDVLRNFDSRRFLFNDETFRLLEQLNVSKTLVNRLHGVERDRTFTEQEMEALLRKMFPDPAKGKLHRTRIMEAAAIANYHHEAGRTLVEVLVCDDAPQFKLLTDELMLCWVHDGRHYKRLRPVVLGHQEKLRTFREEYWMYYHKLVVYKKTPSAERAQTLSAEFDTLFSTTTGYHELDERIAKSKAKKEELLTVLHHPELPLHNNPAEHGARVQKRRADVSLHTKSDEGTKAKDTMMSIVETCKKLGVSAYHFMYDRISQNFQLPSLAELIRTKADSQTILDDSS